MNDTQWPRYQVFLQEKEGEPHQDAGSVHAPDPEMALLNARDVFVRRPECVSLWAVPVNAIYSRTAEGLGEESRGRSELEGAGEDQQGSGGRQTEGKPDRSGSGEPYYVFCKRRPAGTQTLAGQVEAGTPEEALQAAVERFSGRQAPLAWWVFPARSVIQSRPQDRESMFSPALDKPFRLSTGYHTVTAMREIKTPDPKPQEPDPPARAAASSGAANG